MKKAIILGTRPEIIKLSPLIRRMSDKDILVHTNQHYSENMDKVFFDELNLRNPNYNLNVGSGKHGEQTAKMLEKIEQVLIKEKPNVVIVQGDTNSVLAGALAATKLHIKVAHIEAGLRSGDMNMPEEKNRIMTDHISDYLFSPTKGTTINLIKEGLNENKIYEVGNTIVDATLENLNLLNEDTTKEYILLTMHRAENVDNKKRLKYLIEELNKVAEKYEIIYPIHPRTKKMLEKFNIKIDKNIKLIEPQGYLKFLELQKNAKIILTDSGGIQEEACILKVPCVTLRTTTERPETIEVGANILMTQNLDEDISKIIKNNKTWKNPFGQKVTEKILSELK
ncbi:MAG: non-hydrolyzing UDP-N-acetylglucosamine 2-epimerase [archaeon]